MTTTCNKRTQPTHKSTTHRSENSTPPPRPASIRRNALNRRKEHAANMMGNILHYVCLCSESGDHPCSCRRDDTVGGTPRYSLTADLATLIGVLISYEIPAAGRQHAVDARHTHQFTPPLRRCSASPREGFWCRGAGDSYISLRSDRIRRFRPCASRQPHRTDSAPHANREIRTPT